MRKNSNHIVRKKLYLVSGTVKSIGVIDLFSILKIYYAVEILEEQLALFWDLVSNKYDLVLFCSAKVHLVKSPEVFPLQLGRLMVYSDSLRKLNPLQRLIPSRSANVLKHKGCTLPLVALVKSHCSEWSYVRGRRWTTARSHWPSSYVYSISSGEPI